MERAAHILALISFPIVSQASVEPSCRSQSLQKNSSRVTRPFHAPAEQSLTRGISCRKLSYPEKVREVPKVVRQGGDAVPPLHGNFAPNFATVYAN